MKQIESCVKVLGSQVTEMGEGQPRATWGSFIFKWAARGRDDDDARTSQIYLSAP